MCVGDCCSSVPGSEKMGNLHKATDRKQQVSDPVA